MSLFSDLFNKGNKKGEINVQITELTIPEQKSQPEKDATAVRLSSAEQPSPDAKEQKPFEAKKISVWKPGDVILEHYEIEDVITSGGMGRIYIANHQNWKVKIAIKSPTEEMLQDKDFFARVQKEAEAWTELGLHPNIAYCYFVRNIEDIPHIFVEYVDGGNLRHWIEEGKCADLKTGLDLAIQFCHGMAHAHSKGMVHRDIKPANILMTQDGTLKITDFGIAKWVRVDEAGNLHEGSGVDLGGKTPPYASPEQFVDEYNVGFETDVFSFGLCLWEMLCGIKPYTIAVGKIEIPNSRKFRPDLPEKVHILLEQIVAFEKEERQKLGGFEALRERFKSIYQELFRETSPHSELEKLDLRANGLNNRGVSYLELGRKEDAKRCWNDALSIDPKHLEATFNLGYFRWHDGEPYWDTIENPMANLKTTYEGNPSYWLSLAWVHLDRGEVEAIEAIQASSHRVEDGAFLRAWEDPKKPVVRLVKTFEGHADQIYSVVFSPDGRHALSSGCDKTVRLWEIETGRTVRQFDGHTNPVSSIAFSPDGRYILSGADRLILWEVATGRQLREWEGMKIGMLHVVSATFSPDGRHILSCWENYTDFIPNLYVWDVETGDEVARVKGMESGKHLAFSPEGKYVFTGGNARRIQRWLVETGEEVTSFDIYFVSNFALSPCGTYLLTAHPPLGGGGLHLRDTKSGMELKTFYGHTDTVSTVAFSPDGRFVVSGSSDNTLRLWETKTGREIRKFTHANSIYSVAFSPHGAYILSCSGKSLHLYQVFLPHSDGQKKIYERLLLCTVKPTIQVTSEQKRVRMLIESARDLAQGSSFPQAYRCLRQAQMVPGFERDGELLENLVRCGIKGSAKRSGLREYWHRGILKRYKWLSCVAFSPDSRFVLTGGGEQKLVLWDVETGKTKEFDDYIGYVNSVAFSPDGYYALSGSDSLRLRLWGVETGKEVRHFQCVNGSPRPVAFSPDGCRVYCIDGSRFSDSKEYVVIVLDVTSGQELQRLGVGMILCGAFSYDARTVALGYHDGITLLDLDSGGSELDRLTWKDGELSCIAMSADGHHVAFGSYGKTAVIWNVKTGNITNFEGVEGSVHSVAFSPDGNYLLVSSGREVILLNIMTGLEWARFRGHTAEVNSAIFSPNGRYMVSASSDENLRLHELDWEWEFPEIKQEHVTQPKENNFLRDTAVDSNKEIKSPESDTHIIEAEIVDASNTMDSSKFCWSPNDNRMAYLLENYRDYHVEPPPYMGMGYERVGITVIRDGQPFEDEKGGASRGILAGITEDSKYLRWSPDGKYISVISHSGKQLWVVDVGSRKMRVVHAGDEVFTDYFWSPTSEFIAVVGYREEGETNHDFVRILKASELTSEVHQAIYNYNQKFHWPGWVGVYSGFAWSPSGQQYAVGDDFGFRIFNIDGRLFDEFIDSKSRQGTRILSWIREDMLLTDSYDTGITFMHKDSMGPYVATSKNGGKINVFHYDGFLDSFAVSPDRKRCVYLNAPRRFARTGFQVWYRLIVLAVVGERREHSLGNLAVLFTDSPKIILPIKWSPYTSHILLSSDGVAKISIDKDTNKVNIHDEIIEPHSIWVMRTDGSYAGKLANGYDASWSYDGSMIALVKELESGERKLHVLDFKSWLQDKK